MKLPFGKSIGARGWLAAGSLALAVLCTTLLALSGCAAQRAAPTPTPTKTRMPTFTPVKATATLPPIVSAAAAPAATATAVPSPTAPPTVAPSPLPPTAAPTAVPPTAAPTATTAPRPAPTAVPRPPAPAPTAAPPAPPPAADPCASIGGDGCKWRVTGGPKTAPNGGQELKLQLLFIHSGIDGGQPQGSYFIVLEKDGQNLRIPDSVRSITGAASQGSLGKFNYEYALGLDKLTGNTVAGNYTLWVLDGNGERDSRNITFSLPADQGQLWIQFDQS